MVMRHAAYGANNGEILTGIGWGVRACSGISDGYDSYGASFATTLFDWGVQGEVVYR